MRVRDGRYAAIEGSWRIRGNKSSPQSARTRWFIVLCVKRGEKKDDEYAGQEETNRDNFRGPGSL